MAKQTLPNFKLGGSGAKFIGLALVAVLIGCVVTSPLETAAFFKHVIGSLTTFFHSL